MGAKYSASDYARVLRSLLPPGRVWNHEDGSVQASVLTGLAQSVEALDASGISLLADAFPATSVFLLPEWEAALGLPDPCAGESPTLQGRQAQVVSRLTNTGGQTNEFFVRFAAALGYEIQVQECSPFRMGAQRMGSQLGGPDWAFAWTIVSNKGLNYISFRMGQSGMGEPLESWGSAVLQCEIDATKPAHTVVIYQYPLLGADGSIFVLDSSSLA